jgi:hypothetical protein
MSRNMTWSSAFGEVVDLACATSAERSLHVGRAS